MGSGWEACLHILIRSLMGRRIGVRGWWLWRGLLLVLEDTGDFAEKALLLLPGLLVFGLLAVGGGLNLLVSEAEDTREDSLDAGILIAGVGRFGSNDEG